MKLICKLLHKKYHQVERYWWGIPFVMLCSKCGIRFNAPYNHDAAVLAHRKAGLNHFFGTAIPLNAGLGWYLRNILGGGQ